MVREDSRARYCVSCYDNGGFVAFIPDTDDEYAVLDEFESLADGIEFFGMYANHFDRPEDAEIRKAFFEAIEQLWTSAK